MERKYHKWSSILLLCFLCMLLGGTGAKSVVVKADSSNQFLKVNTVTDIYNIQGDIAYELVSVSGALQCTTMKFELKQDGLVKLITNASSLYKTYITNEGTSDHYLQVATRIFRNQACIDQVGSTALAYRNQNSDTGNLYLTKGTYYVQFEATDPLANGAIMEGIVIGTAKTALYFQAKADTSTAVKNLSLTTVKNVDSSTGTVTYKQVEIPNGSNCAVAKITLKEPGAVKLLTNAAGIRQTYIENGATKSVFLKIATRLFQNASCTKQIGEDAVASQNKASESGIFYLEKGTYYIQYDAENAVSDSAIRGTVGIAALYQAYTTQETVTISTKENCNTLVMAKTKRGFLSDISAKDFFQFKATKLMPVKFWCRTYEDGDTTFELYNSNFEKVACGTAKEAMEQATFEKYVNKGTYYLKVQSTARGSYEVRMDEQSYPIALSYKLPFVKVSTVTDYEEIRYLKGNHYQLDLSSPKWEKGTKLKSGKTSFPVNQKGYYTVRVTDNTGKQFIKVIYISKADQTKPKKPVITSAKDGNAYISGKAEKGSTVYVKVNTYKTLHKVKVAANGTYKVSLEYYLFKGDIVKVYAEDKAGNKSAVRTIRV